ncbi:MAG: hypothetical protein CM15mP74_19550 [Halieaceae bacterium]|nr:MAG: hypothetical protein CM15mP74_19550 [Halieaceae bacterium]
MFRLRGKGVKPVRGGPVGDLLCRAVVETPVNLTKEQRALLEEFRGALQAGVSSNHRGRRAGLRASRISLTA